MSDWIAHSVEAKPDALNVVEVGESELWEPMSYFHQRFAPQMLLGIFPSYLQIDIRFYRAVRSLGMSSLAVAQEQMRAGIALIEQLSIGGIVTTAGAYPIVVDALREHSPNSNPYIQVVLGLHERPFATQGKVFFEVHDVPGLPLLYQCENLKNSDFHPTKRFSTELLPNSNRQEQHCECGNSSIVHLN